MGDLAATELDRFSDERDRAFVQACVYGVLRTLFRLRAELASLLERPLRAKDADLEALLLVGLHQLRDMRLPAHAAVSATVEAARKLGKTWACSLVNGLLRQAQRTTFVADSDDTSIEFEHPQWLIQRLRDDWPEDWVNILRQGNRHAPLTLRVNRHRAVVADYLRELEARGMSAIRTRHAEHGLRLTTAVPVTELPGFADGSVTVQDEAAQLAATLLAPQAGDRVLDACAAPGGKTTHMLESVPGLELLALDISAERLAVIAENLKRLGLTCTLRVADAGEPSSWWDGRAFDRILLDAPCSALGIVRRHPDIRVNRSAEDVQRLALLQQRLLNALWPLLRPGGRLVYATCSILPVENDAAVTALLAAQRDARIERLDASWGRPTAHGRQILPGDDEMDGFYYAALTRLPA